MKKMCIISLIFCFNVAFGQLSYDERVKNFWEDVRSKRHVENTAGFLPQRVDQLIEELSAKMEVGEKIIISFYPKNCGWDRLVDFSDELIEVGEFRELAEKWGFKVNFCLPKGFVAEFSTPEELEDYTQKGFGQHPNEFFPKIPVKIVISELEKL